jgi:hypothetical protein
VIIWEEAIGWADSVNKRRARSSAQFANRLLLRIPGDLEAANPTGMNREMRMYLDKRGAAFSGVITTRPPSATGLGGSVSYWLEIVRRP